jgi:hypothetical protein
MPRRKLVLVAVLALAVDLGAQSPAQPPAPPPARFEVASIKLNPIQSRGGPRRLSDLTLSVVRLHPGGRVESVGNSLQNLIAWAYQLNGAYQRVEGKQASGPSVPFTSPDWMQKARCGWTGYNGEQRGVGVSMATVAERLTTEMLAPVADRTGWPGLFSFNVIADTSGMPFQERARASSTLGARLAPEQPPLLDVFRSELGLKLTKDRMTVNDFLVDSAGPLIEN